MLEQVCPILPSANLDVTEAFYKRLGFKTWYKETESYLLMSRDKVEFHFFFHKNHQPHTCDHGVYLRTADVDEFSREMSALGLPKENNFPKFVPAMDRPWGMREAYLWDPDGNLIRAGQEIGRHG